MASSSDENGFLGAGFKKSVHASVRDGMPDHVRLSDLEPLFVCQFCGHLGADVRPLFEPTQHKTAFNVERQSESANTDHARR